MKRFRLVATYRGFVVRKSPWYRVDLTLWKELAVDEVLLRAVDRDLGGPPSWPMPLHVRVEFEDRVSPDAT